MRTYVSKLYAQLIIFFYVADFMSLTKAAKHLGCSKAHVSKQLAELERTVGTPLLHRNVRTMQLTFAGEAILEHARFIVRECQSAENTMAGLQDKVQGVLRITSPTAYAECLLAPKLPDFLVEYPDITLDLNFTGQLLNLVEQKIDVAIRLTHEPPLDRVAKRVGEYRMMVCASMDYLEEHGRPKSPKQLVGHHCLVYSTEKNFNLWPFVIDSGAISVNITPRITANNSQVLLQAAKRGMGIARLPSYVVRDAIQNKQLEVILAEYYPPPIPIYAIFASGRVVPPKIRAFVEFLHRINS
jgi:DNA-binding transcriptional LysR family regulator